MAIGLAFGVVAGRHHLQPGRLALLAGLLATNQYAAGALNDAIDVERDVDAGRAADKPIPSGAISRRAVTVLALASGLASLGFALALGPATLGLAAVAVHLADSLPDVESDRAAGVHGLAPRLGVRAAGTLVAAAYLVAGAIALGSGLAAGDAPVVLVGVVLAAALGLAALAAGSGADQHHRRVAYRLLLAGLVALALGWAAAVRP